MGHHSPEDVGSRGSNLEDSPADQVTQALQQRLVRARQKALEQVSLEDLLFDLLSTEASTRSDAGLLLG
jgi:hypothetical protein